MANYIAIDVGGTKIAIGVGDEKGHFLATEVLPTNTSQGIDSALDEISEAVKRVLSHAEVSLSRIARIGVGSPGPLSGTTLLGTANLPGWKGLDWKSGLEKRLGAPVAVANDATAAGLGEWVFGQGQGTQNCLYVTVSTGIGAGIVASGKLYGGARGNAGEFGHIIMKKDGPRCPAGHSGCLESLASGTAIRRMGQERKNDSEYLKALAQVDTKDVFLGYESGDPVCQDIVFEAADWLGLGLSYLVNLFNPEIIIVGGGVATHAPQDWRDRLWQGIQHWALEAMVDVVKLVPAKLGEESGLMGALALALTDHISQP